MPNKKAAKQVVTGVGLGAGDPEFITLKALRTIEEAEALIAVKTTNKSRALDILAAHFDIKKLPLHVISIYPEKRENKNIWQEAFQKTMRALENKKRIAFVTLGDPLLWSTFLSFAQAAEGYARELEWRAIPGISAASQLLALLGKAEDDNFAICSAEYWLKHNARFTDTNVVIYKACEHVAQLKRLCAKRGLHDAMLAQNLGLDNQQILPLMESDDELRADYFSCICVRAE